MAGLKLTRFKTNAEKETKGVWMDAGEGCKLLIARFNNSGYEQMVRRLSKPHARQARLGTMDDAVLQDIQNRALAKHVLLGWQNLQDGDGNDIPFTEEKALEILRDKSLREFRNIVLEFSMDAQSFRDEDQIDAAGNSQGA